MNIHFPTLNACLNTLSATLLMAGFFFILKKKVLQHRICMGSAVVTSTLFLASYLYYHYTNEPTLFQGQGWIRPVYFTILISHTILAMAVPPLVLIALIRAFQQNWQKHRKIARITFPIWLYVSVTGVIIYFMLY